MHLLGHRSRIYSSLQVRNYYISVEEQSCTPRVKRSIAVMTHFPQQENSAVSKHWIGPYMSTQNRKHSSHHKFSSLMSITIYISLHHMYTKEQIFRDFCLWLCSSWALTYRGPFGRSMHSGWWWIPSAIDVRSVSGFISIPILHGQALRWPGSLPTVPPVNWIPIFWSLGPRKRFGAWVMVVPGTIWNRIFFQLDWFKPPGWYQATCFSKVWRIDFYFC